MPRGQGPGQGLWVLEGVGGGLVGSATRLTLETASRHRLKCAAGGAVRPAQSATQIRGLWQAPRQSPVSPLTHTHSRLRKWRQEDCHFELGYTVLLITPDKEAHSGSHLSSQPGVEEGGQGVGIESPTQIGCS